MTYTESKNTPEAKEWTIRKVNNSYIPVHNGNALPNNFAKKSVDAARIFIACQISHKYKMQEIENRYNPMDWDAC